MRLIPTEKGRRMPVDPDPAGLSGGLERIAYGEVTPMIAIRNGLVHILKPEEPYEGELYVSHFATCPEARRWSKRKVLRRAADRARARVLEGLHDDPEEN